MSLAAFEDRARRLEVRRMDLQVTLPIGHSQRKRALMGKKVKNIPNWYGGWLFQCISTAVTSYLSVHKGISSCPRLCLRKWLWLTGPRVLFLIRPLIFHTQWFNLLPNVGNQFLPPAFRDFVHQSRDATSGQSFVHQVAQ